MLYIPNDSFIKNVFKYPENDFFDTRGNITAFKVQNNTLFFEEPYQYLNYHFVLSLEIIDTSIDYSFPAGLDDASRTFVIYEKVIFDDWQ